MPIVRRILAQRHLALLICAGALLLRIAVPGGYMIDTADAMPTLEVCSGVMPAMAMPGQDDGHRDGRHDGKAEMPCAFAGLSAPALAATDPVQLATLIAFIVASGTAAVALPLLRRTANLRPPLRGPPARP